MLQKATTVSGFYLEYNNGYWQFSRMNTDTTNATGEAAKSDAAATTGWTHLVGTHDVSTGKMTLYVNGVAQSTTATDTSPIPSNGSLLVGHDWYNGAGGNNFNGSIADLRVYSSAVTATQAGNLYAKGSVTGDPSPSSWYRYDSAPGGIGQVSSSTANSDGGWYTTTAAGYDNMGRPLGGSVTIPASEGALAGTYTQNIVYDTVGHVSTTSYSAAGGLASETVTNTYDALGNPNGVTGTGIGSGSTTYVAGTLYTPLGPIQTRTLGPSGLGQVVRTYGYDQQTQQLDTLLATATTAAGTSQIQADTWHRDADGNVAAITSPTQNQCFGYDSLARMTSAYTTTGTTSSTTGDTVAGDCTGANHTAGPAPYDASWQFGDTGNTLSVTNAITSTTNNWSYTDATHAHAPTGQGTDTFGYDADGDMTTRNTAANGNQTLDWNKLGQLADVKVGTNTTGFVYGPDGSRLIRHDPGGATELFLPGEQLTLSGTGTVTAARYYIAPDGTTIAVRTPANLNWLLSDTQGTDNLTVDAATGNCTHQYYTPYGAQRGGNTIQNTTDHAFLDHVQDYGTGLVQDGARYYDPAIGHFISPDPVNTGAPGQLNAYQYADANPVTSSDPSGRMLPSDAGDGGVAKCGDVEFIGPCAGNSSTLGALLPPVTQPTCPDMHEWCGRLGKDPHGSNNTENEDLKKYLNHDGESGYAFMWTAASDAALYASLQAISVWNNNTYASDYLSNWLDSNGDKAMGSDAVMSYYNSTPVKPQIDGVALTEAGTLNVGETGFSSWQSVVSEKGEKHPSISPAEHGNMRRGSDADWYLAFNRADYRVAVTRNSATSITYEVQVVKFYSFDHDFLGYTAKQFAHLNYAGFAQNYVAQGVSSPITISLGSS